MDVEIWSDIACPWCYVGKRRFEAALAAFAHREAVTVTWRSFELDPGAPREYEGDNTTRLARKYGASVEQAVAMQERMAEAAAADGLDLRFDRVRSGNTFDAHRLVHHAARSGRQDAMKERLMHAYLTEGRLIGDHDTLRALAADVGLDPAETTDVLASGAYTDAVREDERLAAGFGISAVPFFVIDRRIGLAGAQAPEVMLEGLARVWAAREDVPVVTGGDSCGPDGC